MTYVFAGYQFDAVSRDRVRFGLEAGGVYFGASGAITNTGTGLTVSKAYQVGMPLARVDFRGWIIPTVLSISADIKGMAFGHGHYVQGSVRGGIGWHGVKFEAAYQVLDADIHKTGGPVPVGHRVAHQRTHDRSSVKTLTYRRRI